VQKFLSSTSLSKKLRIEIYRTSSLPVVLYGCETSSLTVRDEIRVRIGCCGGYLDLKGTR
jgi:hypothetical protein